MFDYQLLQLFVLCTVHISCYFEIELYSLLRLPNV